MRLVTLLLLPSLGYADLTEQQQYKALLKVQERLVKEYKVKKESISLHHLISCSDKKTCSKQEQALLDEEWNKVLKPEALKKKKVVKKKKASKKSNPTKTKKQLIEEELARINGGEGSRFCEEFKTKVEEQEYFIETSANKAVKSKSYIAGDSVDFRQYKYSSTLFPIKKALTLVNVIDSISGILLFNSGKLVEDFIHSFRHTIEESVTLNLKGTGEIRTSNFYMVLASSFSEKLVDKGISSKFTEVIYRNSGLKGSLPFLKRVLRLIKATKCLYKANKKEDPINEYLKVGKKTL